MQADQTVFRTLKDTPKEEYMVSGSPLCPGCGGEVALRLALKALGERTVVVLVPSCFGLLTLYPYSSMKNSTLFTPFACAPAAAQGLVDGMAIRVEKGEISDPAAKTLVVTGDGAAYDIGLQSTSGAIHRRLDFYYLCYDNEAYGNTGFQFSSATPFASATTTTHATDHLAGNQLGKKDLFEIWRSHHPPYVATVSISRPTDLLRKFEKASKIRGPKLFIALGICPTGWGSEPRESVRLDRLAVETGLWPLKEAVGGRVVHSYIPRKRLPVEEYLKKQKRFQHLFKPRENRAALQKIQNDVDEYWATV